MLGVKSSNMRALYVYILCIYTVFVIFFLFAHVKKKQ